MRRRTFLRAAAILPFTLKPALLAAEPRAKDRLANDERAQVLGLGLGGLFPGFPELSRMWGPCAGPGSFLRGMCGS
jgi:hypothetical protein